MIYALYTIHIAISLFLIMVVLLQSGRSADLSALGGGATQTTFGARGATSLLHRLTVICFVLFIVTTLTIGIFQSGGSSSVMDEVAPATSEESAPEAASPDGTEAQSPEGAAASSAADPDGENAGAGAEEASEAEQPAEAPPSSADPPASNNDN